MMNNMLDDLAYGFSEKDSEMFDSVHADFEKNASVTADEQERILSSVMRKAGFDMKENITMKKTRKINKRIAGIIIAAAVMLIGAVTTAAYYAGYRLEDGQIIRKFYGENAETWLDSNGLKVQQAEQNDHFKITMYSPVSDGIYCNTLWCIEALDEVAQEQLGGIDFYHIQPYYADTGEEININGSYGAYYEPFNDEFHHYYLYKMMLRNVDTSRDIEFRIEDKPVYEWQVYDFTLKDGIKFVVNASSNVETKTIANESGRELLLSPLGISQKFRDDDYDPDGRYVYLIRSDGSYEHHEGFINGIMNYDDPENPLRIMIDIAFDVTDISDVIGVKIDDDIYLEVNR